MTRINDPVDLYLLASNPFERIPIQTALTYINDYDLFSKMGRVGSMLLPKDYSQRD